jgi:hypothetical protein
MNQEFKDWIIEQHEKSLSSIRLPYLWRWMLKHAPGELEKIIGGSLANWAVIYASEKKIEVLAIDFRFDSWEVLEALKERFLSPAVVIKE